MNSFGPYPKGFEGGAVYGWLKGLEPTLLLSTLLSLPCWPWEEWHVLLSLREEGSIEMGCRQSKDAIGALNCLGSRSFCCFLCWRNESSGTHSQSWPLQIRKTVHAESCRAAVCSRRGHSIEKGSGEEHIDPGLFSKEQFTASSSTGCTCSP